MKGDIWIVVCYDDYYPQGYKWPEDKQLIRKNEGKDALEAIEKGLKDPSWKKGNNEPAYREDLFYAIVNRYLFEKVDGKDVFKYAEDYVSSHEIYTTGVLYFDELSVVYAILAKRRDEE